MKSFKVILFCVLIFCSKFVESVPFSEELSRQRAYQPSNWPVNQNVPGQYQNNGYTRTQNGNTLTNSALQNDNTQDYYANQGRYNYGSHGYNNNPVALPLAKEVLVDFNSPANGQILGSFPPRVNNYPPRIDASKVGLDNQQYKNQNWQSQNQFVSPAASEAVIADNERPLITPVREPYRGPVQYLPTKYIPASTRQNYQADRTYQAREQYQYPVVDNSGKNRYVANSAIRPGSSSFIPYENSEGQAITSNTKAKKTGGIRYVASSAFPTETKYNGVPALITDPLADKSGKNKYVENSRANYALSNTAPVNNQEDVPARISDTLTKQFENDKYVNSYGTNFGPNNLVPADADTGAAVALNRAVLANPGNNKYGDNYGPQYKSSSPAPFDETINPDQNIHQLPSGVVSYGVKNFASDPQIKSHLAANKKRFVIFHLNGTVEHVDNLDPTTFNNPKYRLVRANRNNVDGTKEYTEEFYTTQSPAYVQDSIATTAIPVDKHKLPASVNLPANDNNSNSTLVVPSEYDDKLSTTTLSRIGSDNNTSPLVPTTPENNQTLLQSTTNSSNVVTTPCPDNSTDYIITISPIELATDNVSDVPPMTTITASPVTTLTPSTMDNVTNAYNKKDDARNDTTSSTKETSILDKVQYSTTTKSPSSSVSPIDNSSGDEIIVEIITNKNNTQSANITAVNQGNNGNNDTQTATYNSLTNTDVPAKLDDNSPVTTEPSIQNDVNTGDISTTPGDNLLESKESVTDLKITVNTTNDSEADIITVSIEVLESTDGEDSSSDDTLVVSIDTKKSNDDDSKTSKTGDCKKDHSSNDDKGKNLEIDLSNIKGEPTMWFKTTNQDFIDKLMSKNDTKFDIIYFFQVKNEPIVEKDKKTIIYCNGTVVVESTETTWQYTDDPTPTIIKTTKIMQIEDYEP